MHTERTVTRTMMALGLLLALAGCGQKGPLRLPDPPPAESATPVEAVPAAAPADQKDPTSLSARRGNPHE